MQCSAVSSVPFSWLDGPFGASRQTLRRLGTSGLYLPELGMYVHNTVTELKEDTSIPAIQVLPYHPRRLRLVLAECKGGTPGYLEPGYLQYDILVNVSIIDTRKWSIPSLFLHLSILNKSPYKLVLRRFSCVRTDKSSCQLTRITV